MVRYIFAGLTLLSVTLLVVPVLGPLAVYIRADRDSAAAEERLRDAEREAEQAAREHDLDRSTARREHYEQATRSVRGELATHRQTAEQRDSAWDRLIAVLSRRARVLSD